LRAATAAAEAAAREPDISVEMETTPSEPPGFTIAGIGASAGGLEALSQLLSAMGNERELALVVVQHLSAEHDSVLPELLAPSTSWRVEQVTQGVVVRPGHVYVIPPDAEMGISDGKLQLLPRPKGQSGRTPINHFFESLSHYAHSRAIGVVLSGTASDGALGLREIKAAGGITIAQDPKTAKFDGMPRAAIATNAVDLVLPPQQIATELIRIARAAPAVPESVAAAEAEQAVAAAIAREHVPATQHEQLNQIFQLLRSDSGVDFTHYKLPTIRRRLQRRLVLHKLDGLDDYLKLLRQRPDEIHSLYSDLLIHVTRFFRDPDSYAILQNRIFPTLLQDRHGDDAIRLWVPGCSTGEEAYSVAIALLEFLGDSVSNVQVQVFATDVSEGSIDHARAGVYPESISDDVSSERLRRFFNRVDGSYRIVKQVRDLCVFARQDLTRDPPFSKLDLIVCRNVLIYLGAVLQKKLMNVFHYALKPAGYLMLGNAETIGSHSELFGVVDKRHKIYSKKLATVRADVEFPVEYAPGRRRAETSKRPTGELRGGMNVQNEVNRVLLSRFAPPGVVVDGDLRIVQFRGQTGAYLEPAPGEASLDLLKMAREGLLYGLRTALLEARRTDQPVRKQHLRVKQDGHTREVDLEVIPLKVNLPGQRHFLILFQEPGQVGLGQDRRLVRKGATGKAAGKGAAARGRGRREDDERVERLERELAASREYLQSMIQDLEAANEELQSANEEILSANEELQSTNEELDTAKEELQSTNEELNTVNEELQGRNEQLSRANSDLLNLLGSVQIAIVMVASDLRIRRFTPMAEKVLNLIPTDVGRPIGDIKPNIDAPDLEQMISEAIDTVTPKEREVLGRDGRWYILRVRPYKNVDNRIDGAVLALFDTSASARVARQLEAAHAAASDGAAAADDARQVTDAVVTAIARPVMVLDEDQVVRLVNEPFVRMFALGSEQLIGRSMRDLSPSDSPLRRALHELRHVLAGESVRSEARLSLSSGDGHNRDVTLTATRSIAPVDGEIRAPIICIVARD
jgi:two-component system CheB/CheR fusion protein